MDIRHKIRVTDSIGTSLRASDAWREKMVSLLTRSSRRQNKALFEHATFHNRKRKFPTGAPNLEGTISPNENDGLGKSQSMSFIFFN